MKIRYSVRSSFLLPCRMAIKKYAKQLQQGLEISINFPSGGYEDKLDIDIQPSDQKTFGTDWNRDPTRFPARIKAAATALKDAGYVGRYQISYEDGTLSIRQH